MRQAGAGGASGVRGEPASSPYFSFGSNVVKRGRVAARRTQDRSRANFEQ